MLARRIHIWKDGFGWSGNDTTPIERFIEVKHANQLPKIAEGAVITFFTANNSDDLAQLRDMIQELHTEAKWYFNED